MARMPDFIIIGAMKCATSTLHEQLARQPGMWMTEPKEPCFFSDDEIYTQGIDWYASLFAGAAPGDLCGESSTHYTKLPTYPETVARICEHVPDAKLIYVMRHPVDRLVSQYIHEWTQGLTKSPVDDALDELPELIAYSRYAYQLDPFFAAFGNDRILPVFFERLVAHPQEELARVCAFLGYEAQPRWHADADEQNRSDQRMRPNKLRDAVAYAPGISALRKYFVPRSLRERIKNLWRMPERPELSETARRRIEEECDRDLQRLGAWLGWELNCGNFKTTVRDAVPQWQERAGAKHEA